MQNRSQYWLQHVAAARIEGITLGAYAKQHGLGASTLYRWAQTLQATKCKTTTVQPTLEHPGASAPGPGKFIALRVASNEPATAVKPNITISTTGRQATACTLNLPGGIDLQLTALPEPAWLVALSRCAWGEH